MRVREKVPREFWAVKMNVSGKGVSDNGSYEYEAGDYLLFNYEPSPDKANSTEANDACDVIDGSKFDDFYETI